MRLKHGETSWLTTEDDSWSWDTSQGLINRGWVTAVGVAYVKKPETTD